VNVEVPETISEQLPERARDIAVLIVAYRAADKLERCIESVSEFLPGHEVHVWDNSGPGSSDVCRLADRLPRIHWHLGSENIGFAAAANKLAAMVPHSDFLLLNPDAELIGPMTLTRAALDESDVAAVAPMTSEWHSDIGTAPRGSNAHLPWDVAHRRLTLINAIGGPLGLAERLRGTPFSNLYRSQPVAVGGYLTGACLLIRRGAWNSLGPFDEEFFLYGEEADWQKRAVETGWRLRLADEIAVLHRANGTVAGDPIGFRKSQDLLRASVALQLEYRHGSRTADLYLAITSLCEGVKQKLRRRRSREAAHNGVVVTVDDAHDSASVRDRIRIVSELSHNGFAVTVISLRRIGTTLPRQLPPSARLLRRPWWWPWLLPDETPATMVFGTTGRERAAAWLFRRRHDRLCIEASAAIDALIGEPSGPLRRAAGI
jgi:GT2 family glycosyltransferase